MGYKITSKLAAIFYRTSAGHEPVREWLKQLPIEDKKAIGQAILTVQYGWPIGMPLVGSLGHGLWEVRITLVSARIARIIFFMDTHTMVLVHGFIKKTQKTLSSDLSLALKRKQVYEAYKKQVDLNDKYT
jgi:phage-related protein